MTAPRYVNLLPHSFRRQAALRGRHRFWKRTVGLTAVACFVVPAAWHSSLSTLRTQAQQLASRCEPLERLQAETRGLLRNDPLPGPAASLTGREPVVQLLGAVGAAAQPAGPTLRVDRLELTSPTPSAEKSQVAGSRVAGELRLVGQATDDLAVTGFVDRLRSGAAFATVTLTAASRNSGAGKDRNFEILCQLWGRP